jgi:hypothetical protein
MIAKSKPGNSPIKSINPSQLPEHYNLGIGGGSGAGKTHLAGTIGKGKRGLVWDTEGGTSTFNSPSFLSDPAATEPENLDIVPLHEITDVKELVHTVESGLDYLIRTKNSDDYNVVVLDSLTEFQALFLSLDNAADPRQSYGRLQDALHNIIRKARQVPAHTIFTARLRYVNDEVLGREVVRFEVSPGVWGITSGLFDMIGFLTLRSQGVRHIRELDFNHTTRTPGKDRAGVGKLDDPKLTKLFAAVAGDKKVPAKAA